ncbi:DNA internalization-related competence protein ComEC/Rec2 [Planococcus sp. ISL-109]|uniref:DNA internalization-related competence protein ComEC/Rec2 n=1 Tax=Planococcus sp. ISL-109 TaxID=2819166 RepID=UPI002035E8EC|nr:DNA internalization-related competence protein ComEC/Rec2 [Planococcus sp. ISL-109]
MAIIAIFAIAAFFLAQSRLDDGPLLSGDYEGVVEFHELSIDGARLNGFAIVDSGQKVYASYQIGSAEEKKALHALGPAIHLRVRANYTDPKNAPHEFAFNMQHYLEKNNARGMLTIESIVAAAPRGGIKGSLAQQREKLLAHIERSFPAALVTEAHALLLGERGGLDGEQARIQRTLGITHLFAISGLHVGIITAMLYFALLRIRIRKETATILLIMVLPLYAILAGAAPSVMRACAMVVLVLLARLFGIHVSVIQALSASFIAFLLFEPSLLFDIGFQLSYGASFGIIASLKLLEGASFFKGGLIVTAVSQLSLYPLLLFHFYEISLSSFLVNALYVPLFTVFILPANFMLLALSFFPGNIAQPFFALYEPLRLWIAQLTNDLATVPHQLWTPGKPALGLVLIMAACVLVFFVQTEKRWRLRYVLVLVSPALLISAKPYVDPALYVSFIDVGQGDSILIELPYRRGVYLIDSGGVLRFGEEGYQQRTRPYEVGRGTVVPYLKGRGISQVDLFILSHPDADHAEGADEIFEELDVERLHITPGSEANAMMSELAPLSKEAAVETPGKGVAWNVGSTRFMYLSPDDDQYEGNDDSLVLLMEHGGQRFLFTGDLEEKGEREIVEGYAQQLAELTVLKVGHHGSKTSSSQIFLEALEPDVSIVSAGKDNRYGHPSPEVTARFESLDLLLLSTAENGTIRITVKNGNTTIDSSRK